MRKIYIQTPQAQDTIFYVEDIPNARRKNHGTVVHPNISTIKKNGNTWIVSNLN
jgi:hypothetical protein